MHFPTWFTKEAPRSSHSRRDALDAQYMGGVNTHLPGAIEVIVQASSAMDFEVQLNRWRASVSNGNREASSQLLREIQVLSESDSDGAHACLVSCISVAQEAGATVIQLDALLTQLRVVAARGEVAECRSVLEEMAPLCQHLDKAYDGAKELVEVLRTDVFPKTPPDQGPHLLAVALDITDPVDDPEITIELLRLAAITYADHGSFQPAYGALSDAEHLAHRHRRVDLLARVLSTMHCVCILEADHTYADKIWPVIEKIHRDLEVSVSPGDLANRATCLMRLERYAEAADKFQEVLEAQRDDEPGLLFPIHGNLAACLRESGDLEGAKRAMGQAWGQLERATPQVPLDQVLELHLIDAKTSCALGDLSYALHCLHQASGLLDELAGGTMKLHYRREVRERYTVRIEALLGQLEPEGATEDVLEIIATVRMNQLADWLYLVQWCDDAQPVLSPGDREALAESVAQLRNFGAPALMGYREKYDDPVARYGGPRDPWVAFSELAERLRRQHGLPDPMEAASSARVAGLLRQRLRAGAVIMATWTAGGRKALVMDRDRYVLCDLPAEPMADYWVTMMLRQTEQSSRSELNRAINTLQPALMEALSAALTRMCAPSCTELILLPDASGPFPVGLITVGDSRLRERMAQGAFAVRTCLALFPAPAVQAPYLHGIAVTDSNSGLRYADAEARHLLSAITQSHDRLDAPSSDVLDQHLRTADVLLVARHAISAGAFTDPYFANTDGDLSRSGIWFATVQESAWKWPTRLVILGVCHGGSMSNRNAQKRFRTHEALGYPAAFLTSRRCAVTGAAWAVVDSFNFLLSAALAEDLAASDVATAFSRGLARVVEMPTKEALDLFRSATAVDGSLPAMEPGRLDQVRSQPYCYAAYHLFTLL